MFFLFNFLEGEKDSCISFVRSCSVTIVSIQEVRGWDVMFNLIRTECFMERVLGIYVVGIIVSSGFLFIQEVRNGRRRSYTEEGASMLVGIICAFLWPLVLIAYFFDKKNGKL